MLLLFVFLFFPLWAVYRFGNVELEKIIFHLFVPMKNMPTDWLEGIWVPIILTLCFYIFTISYKSIFVQHKNFSALLFVFLLLFDIEYIERHFFVYDYLLEFWQESKFIEDNYVHPSDVVISFPKRKRNLIFIQVESLENSLQDRKSGGFFEVNYIPKLTEIAKKNISFSHSNLIEGATVLPSTGWTIAGMVAETAGIPLKLHGGHFGRIDNSMDRYGSFLPGVISLGDILKNAGYQNVFILGTGKEFAGKENYMTNHGNYQIFDQANIGFTNEYQPDRVVFEFSKKKALELSKNEKNFHLFILTADTHLGSYCPQSCPKVFAEDFKNGYSCVDKLVDEFIKWIEQQDFYSNTTVVVLGDHCSHSNDVASHVETLDHDDMTSRHNGNIKRKVYNAFINPAVKPSSVYNRKFSTMDMFPTILASIGVKIEGDRLGLGTNLFSDRKTLPEVYGYDYIFEELKKKSLFYDYSLLYHSHEKK